MKLMLGDIEVADIDSRKMKREPLTLTGLMKLPKFKTPATIKFYYKCLCEVQSHLDRLAVIDAEFSMLCLTFGLVKGSYLKNDQDDQNCKKYFRKINQ